MFDNFCHWFRYSTLIEKAIVLVIMLLVLIVIVGVVDPGDAQANRKTFCLDRGYDKYETSQGNFYCKNSANGDIKRFSDPSRKKIERKARSWE